MSDGFQEDDDGAAQSFAVPEGLSGERIDKALAALCPELSRSRLKTLIEDGEVMLNGRACTTASHKVTAGQEIAVNVPDPVEATPQPEDIPLDIVYEDESLLVINKQAGLVVHPGAGNWTGTLVNALLYHCGDTLSGIGGVLRPGIVHRLDKDTTGLMVVAKSDVAHRGLSAQLSDRSLSRTYIAVTWKVPPMKGVIDKPIARHAIQRQRMTIPPQGGREARTHYQRLEVYRDIASGVQCDLETGRTHQIRVHMAAIGHPLVGDALYGLQENAQLSLLRKAGYDEGAQKAVLGFPRQALHAAAIRFIHPVTEEEMDFEASLPEDLVRLTGILRGSPG